MNEKKLTDEEVIEALACCVKGETCTTCPYFIKLIDCIYHRRAEGDALDLIHRLQSENERLTEKNESLEERNRILKKYKSMWAELDTKNAEIQKQVDELTAFKNEAISLSLYKKGRKDGEEIGYRQAVKDTVKEMIEEIDNVKEIFPNDIVGYEQAQGWCMCVDKLKEIAKNKGVEME